MPDTCKCSGSKVPRLLSNQLNSRQVLLVSGNSHSLKKDARGDVLELDSLTFRVEVDHPPSMTSSQILFCSFDTMLAVEALNSELCGKRHPRLS